MQLSVAARNAVLDALETLIGASPVLEIRSGAAPANCAAADAGNVLVSMTLPADWLGDASGGSKSLAGSWQDPAADLTGTAGHYRIKSSGGTCHVQGTVSATGGSGELQLDDDDVVAGQLVTITTAAFGSGNA
jgi:hypothetical protein